MATCVLKHCFCEAVRHDQAVRQPVNAWTSLAFVFAGMLVIGQSHFDRSLRPVPARNPLTEHALYGVVGGIALLITGWGSVFFHASLTFIGEFFDLLGMYLLVSFILFYAWVRMFGLSKTSFLTRYLLLNLALIVLYVTLPEARLFFFAAVLLMGLIFEWRWLRAHSGLVEARWLQGSLLLFAAAYAIWILDNTHILCLPESLVQGHGIWHIAGAVAAWMLFVYYRSEVEERRL